MVRKPFPCSPCSSKVNPAPTDSIALVRWWGQRWGTWDLQLPFHGFLRKKSKYCHAKLYPFEQVHHILPMIFRQISTFLFFLALYIFFPPDPLGSGFNYQLALNKYAALDHGSRAGYKRVCPHKLSSPCCWDTSVIYPFRKRAEWLSPHTWRHHTLRDVSCRSGKVRTVSSPRLPQLVRGADNAKVTGLIPEQAIHVGVGLNDLCGYISTQNIPWFCETCSSLCSQGAFRATFLQSWLSTWKCTWVHFTLQALVKGLFPLPNSPGPTTCPLCFTPFSHFFLWLQATALG